MNDLTLIKISLSVSFIGIFLLFILSFYPEKPRVIDNDINLYGVVNEVRYYPKHTIVSLLASEKKTVIIFGHPNLKESDVVKVEGVKQNNKIYATRIIKYKNTE